MIFTNEDKVLIKALPQE